MKYGLESEPKAIEKYEEQTNSKVHLSGLWVNPKFPFLACSPDGLVDSNVIIEIKSLKIFKQHSVQSITSPANNSPVSKDVISRQCFTIQDGKCMLKRTHVYYNQIQHLLLVTEREFCDFTLYAEKGPVTIERIPRDEPLISRILTFLTELWTRVIAPEIFEMRIPRGLTPFILPQETSYAFEPDPSPHNVQEDMAAADPVSATSCEPLDNDDLDNKLTELPTFDSCAPVISSHTQEEMDAAEVLLGSFSAPPSKSSVTNQAAQFSVDFYHIKQ